MTHKEFNAVVDKELEYVKTLLTSKSKEYDFGQDRFHSFKVGGELQGVSQEKCLLGYLTKHIVSIYDMCNEIENFSYDKFVEKITDYLNYGLLLLGMIAEEKQITFDNTQSTGSVKVTKTSKKAD
jgi:hypothetical protein